MQRSSGDAPIGILLADEMGRNKKLQLQRSEGNLIYNNIVVGMSQNFAARESKNSFGALRNTHIFNNTFVNAQRKSSPPINVRIPPTDQHANSIFENNLIVQDEGVIAQVGGGNEVLCRNNLWSREPPAAAKGPGDRVGDPHLQSPKLFPPVPAHFKLTSRSTLAIGAALRTNASEDFFRTRRDTNPDIGAHEYNGTVNEEPAEGPEANFRVSGRQRSGTAPHMVKFRDQSKGEIRKWEWTFGERKGRSTESNPTYTYESPGEYDITLNVTDNMGQTDSVQKSRFIVVQRDKQKQPDATLEHFTIEKAELYAFRRFVLYDIESACSLAIGIQFPDLSCVLQWLEDLADHGSYTVHYDHIMDVEAVYLQPKVTELKWLDVGSEE